MSQREGQTTPVEWTGDQIITDAEDSVTQLAQQLAGADMTTPRQTGKRPRFEDSQDPGPSTLRTGQPIPILPFQHAAVSSAPPTQTSTPAPALPSMAHTIATQYTAPQVPMYTVSQPRTIMQSTPREIRLNPPKDFDGSSNKLKGFLLDVELYLDLNDNIFHDDKAKNMYLLSFFKEKEALLWKDHYLESIRIKGGFKWPKHDDLKELIRRDFARTTEIEDAITALEHLKQGSKPISEFNIDFKLLLGKAGKGTNTSDNFLIRLYSRAINSKTAEKVITMDNPPTTLDDWMDKAAKFDSNWRRASALLGRGAPKGQEKGKRQWHFSRPARDPNAMDVDVLSVEEKEQLKKKGLCFRCRTGKHLANECTVFGNGKGKEKAREEPKKPLKGKDLYAQIRAMTNELDEEEQDEFWTLAEKEGF